MTPQSSEQLLNLLYIPTAIENQEIDGGTRISKKSFSVESEDEGSSVLITAKTSEEDSGVAKAVISQSLNLLLEQHDLEHQRITKEINNKINVLDGEISALLNNQKSGEPTSEVLEKKTMVVLLQTSLALSKESEIILQESPVPVDSKSPILFGVGGLVAGLFVGCFVVFFLELYAKAKIRASETA
jgi:SpoU rRNA methylase family enzyme